MMTRWLIVLTLLVGLAGPALGATKYADTAATGCEAGTNTDYDPTANAGAGGCGSGSSTVYIASSPTTALQALVKSDILYFRAGTYALASAYGDAAAETWACQSGGCPTSWATATQIKNYPGEAVVWQIRGVNFDGDLSTGGAAYVILEGDSRSNFIIEMNGTNQGFTGLRAVDGANHIRWKKLTLRNYTDSGIVTTTNSSSVVPTNIELIDCLVTNNGDSTNGSGTIHEHGFYPVKCIDCLIEKNYFYSNHAYAIHINSASNAVTGMVIRYNLLEGRKATSGTSFGIFVDDASDTLIYRNIILTKGGATGTQTGCIQLGSNAVRTLVYHNLCYGTGSGIGFQISGNATNSSVINNIWNNITAASTFDLQAGSGTTGNGNLCPSNDADISGACDVNTTTPGFVSAGTTFSLAAGAAAIDAGVAIAGYSYNGSLPDIGPFETVTHASCVVEDGDASTLRATYTNNAFPPMQITDSTGVTTRKAGAANAPTAVTITGDNRLDLTLTNAIVNGNTVDWTYAQTGDLRDSANIGGTLTQEALAHSQTSCTNNVGAAASHLFIQAAYKWHGLRGTEAAPVALRTAGGESENLNIKPMPGGKARLRFSVTCSTADCPPEAFYPYVDVNSAGSYAVVPDTFGSANIAFCGTGIEADVPTSGEATTDQLSTSGTFVAGALVRTSNAIPTVDLDNDPASKTELEYCFVWDTDAAADATYDFRLRKQDGSVLDTYTVTPRATIQAIGAGGGF
jgi:hypothetical protein